MVYLGLQDDDEQYGYDAYGYDEYGEYGDEGRRKSVDRMREPAAGELRVKRTGDRDRSEIGRRRGAGDELEVPEFMPNR